MYRPDLQLTNPAFSQFNSFNEELNGGINSLSLTSMTNDRQFNYNRIEKTIFVVFGPPGSGKGTFSQLAKDRYGYTHLSVGDLVRKEIEQQTEMGKEADICLKKGNMLQESAIQAFVLKYLLPLLESKKPFVLDGFPRTQEAVDFIQNIFRKNNLSDKVLLILTKSDDVVCEDRILSRVLCKQCSTVYNLKTHRPKNEDTCDACHSPLKTRTNDTLEIVRKRLEEYHLTTEKAYEAAKKFFPAHEFDANQPLEKCIEDYTRFFDEM